MEMYSTAEGLTLSMDNKADKLNKSEIELTALHELILSENDGNELKVSKWILDTRQRLCENTLGWLKIFSLLPDSFERLYSKENVLIFYTWNNIVYMPRCVQVKEIEIFDNEDYNAQKDCSVEMKIRFSKNNNNESIIGWLTPNLIIRNEDKIVKHGQVCDHIHSVYLPNKQAILTVDYGKVTVTQTGKPVRMRELDVDVRNINFKHYNNLLEQVDITKSIGREHSGEKKESESFAKFLANSKEKSKSMIKQDLDIVFNSIEIIWSKTKWIIPIIFVIIVISILLIISLKIMSIVN